MTLLEETLSVLASYGKTPADVVWCGDGEDLTFSWDTFEENAQFEYDRGYGAQEVATDLKIVGEDWWLERNEYDGSENWVFQTMPKRSFPEEPLYEGYVELGGGKWDTLAELNEDYDEDDDDYDDEDYDDDGDYE